MADVQYRSHLTYPVVLVDRWGATDDLATSSLHSCRLSAFLMAAPSVMPVHSGMLSSHLFFCLPRLLPPCTVPCRIVLASPEDLVMCPYHFSLRRFTVVKRSSWGPCNDLPSSVSHLFVGDVVSVGDAEELSEASHLHGLYPSLYVCC